MEDFSGSYRLAVLRLKASLAGAAKAFGDKSLCRAKGLSAKVKAFAARLPNPDGCDAREYLLGTQIGEGAELRRIVFTAISGDKLLERALRAAHALIKNERTFEKQLCCFMLAKAAQTVEEFLQQDLRVIWQPGLARSLRNLPMFLRDMQDGDETPFIRYNSLPGIVRDVSTCCAAVNPKLAAQLRVMNHAFEHIASTKLADMGWLVPAGQRLYRGHRRSGSREPE